MKESAYRSEALHPQANSQTRPRRERLEAVRWTVRIGCLAVLTALLWPGVQLWPNWLRPAVPQWLQRLESPESARLVPSLSPWIALSSLAATHTLSLAAGLGLGVGLLVLFRRRMFCRWACPMGVCTELAGRAGRLCRLRAFRLAPVGQWIALLTLAGAVLGYPLLLWMDPLALWAGWITPASGYPKPDQPPNLAVAYQGDSVHQSDRIPPTKSAPQKQSLTQPDGAKQPGTDQATAQPAHRNWFAAGAAAVLLIGFLLPGLWCTRLCPLGGLQEILWQLRQMVWELVKRAVWVFRPAPASCAPVSSQVPAAASSQAPGTAPSQALAPGAAQSPAITSVYALAPASASSSGPAPSQSPEAPPAQPSAESAWIFGRRVVLAGLVGAVWAAWTKCLRAGLSVPKVLAGAWLGKEQPVPPAPAGPLRPPGATQEEVFSGLCIRCGNCIRACPSRILVPQGARPSLAGLLTLWSGPKTQTPVGAQQALAGFLTPMVRLDQDYCREDCVRCTQVCPTGALRPILPAEKPKVRIGLARVDMGRCMLAEARECFICRDRCPQQAIRTPFSPITYMVEVQIDPARCNGCGACQASCPTWPRAIVVHPV